MSPEIPVMIPSVAFELAASGAQHTVEEFDPLVCPVKRIRLRGPRQKQTEPASSRRTMAC